MPLGCSLPWVSGRRTLAHLHRARGCASSHEAARLDGSGGIGGPLDPQRRKSGGRTTCGRLTELPHSMGSSAPQRLPSPLTGLVSRGHRVQSWSERRGGMCGSTFSTSTGEGWVRAVCCRTGRLRILALLAAIATIRPSRGDPAGGDRERPLPRAASPSCSGASSAGSPTSTIRPLDEPLRQVDHSPPTRRWSSRARTGCDDIADLPEHDRRVDPRDNGLRARGHACAKPVRDEGRAGHSSSRRRQRLGLPESRSDGPMARPVPDARMSRTRSVRSVSWVLIREGSDRTTGSCRSCCAGSDDDGHRRASPAPAGRSGTAGPQGEQPAPDSVLNGPRAERGTFDVVLVPQRFQPRPHKAAEAIRRWPPGNRRSRPSRWSECADRETEAWIAGRSAAPWRAGTESAELDAIGPGPRRRGVAPTPRQALKDVITRRATPRTESQQDRHSSAIST